MNFTEEPYGPLEDPGEIAADDVFFILAILAVFTIIAFRILEHEVKSYPPDFVLSLMSL